MNGYLHDPLYVLFADRMIDRLAAAGVLDFQQRLGRIFEVHLAAAGLRDVGQALAGQRLSQEQFAITTFAGSPAPRSNLSRSMTTSLIFARCSGASSRSTKRLLAAFLGPLRDQAGRAGARRRVRVLIDSHVDAARAGFLHQLESFRAHAPIRLADDLVMRDLRGHVAVFADPDGFPDAIQNVRRLVPHVRMVHASHRSRNFLDLDHFFSRA